MDRLTERVGEDFQCNNNECMLSYCNRECNHYQCMINKLAEYEDAEYNGFLLRTKCKLGDIVYALWSIPTESKYVVYLAEVKEINLSSTNARKMIMYKLEPVAYRGRYNKFYDDDFGKFVFVTKEEAEAALENMKGEEHE